MDDYYFSFVRKFTIMSQMRFHSSLNQILLCHNEVFNFETDMHFWQPPKGLDVDSTFLSEQSKTKSTFDYILKG